MKMDYVKYLALLLVLLSASMVTMADDSSEENDENEAEEEQEDAVEANTNDIMTAPSVNSAGTQNVGSKGVIIPYGNVQKPSSTSKSVVKAKAVISKITKKINRVVGLHRQRFSFYRCQTSCLVGAISCMNTCRTKGAYTFYREQYMVCGRKCRFNQYRCKKVCKDDLSRTRAEQMRRLRS